MWADAAPLYKSGSGRILQAPAWDTYKCQRGPLMGKTPTARISPAAPEVQHAQFTHHHSRTPERQGPEEQRRPQEEDQVVYSKAQGS